MNTTTNPNPNPQTQKDFENDIPFLEDALEEGESNEPESNEPEGNPNCDCDNCGNGRDCSPYCAECAERNLLKN